MKLILLILEVTIAVSLVTFILIQNSKGGLGSAFGGGGEFRTKRGAEQLVFKSTIILAILFLIFSLTNAFIQ